ncbi:MAG: hypothetical protein EHM43_00465 [Ignavibacteriae bacterium]|jgi:opacity protein-like surface antigen|nr:MAG: hypothetical protein EHM43_00465 [Ignavibacteriota bacterium]
MTTRILPLLTLAILALGFAPSAAQEADTERTYLPGPTDTIDDRLIDQIKEQPLSVIFGANFMVTNPQDTLRDALARLQAPEVGYGFAVFAGYSFDPAPIVLTGEFAMSFFGSNERKYVVPSGPYFRDTITYTTQMMQMPITVAARFQPNIGTWVYPYVEAVGGMTLFSSMLDITRTNGEMQNSDSESEGSVSWQYGAGAGMMIKLADMITLPSTLQRFLLDVRFRYLLGTDVDVASIKINDDQTYTVTKASVPNPEVIHFNIGFAVMF